MDDVKGKMKGILKKVNKTLSASSSTGKFQGQGRILGSKSSEEDPPIVSPLVQRFSPKSNLNSPGKRTDKIHVADSDSRNNVAGRIGEFVSNEPPKDSIDVVLKLMRNVVREPENEKFRKIRMGNEKIKRAVGEIKGGIEVLESVGFRMEEEGGEIWAKMGFPGGKEIGLIKEAVELLERWTSDLLVDSEKRHAQEKIDRKVRVFFSVPETEAAKIDLPESFYSLSAMEIRKEAELRRKKIEESQILMPKSFREKQMKASQKKYSATCIRVQFPDGVVLQGVFLPSETTTSLYEFVSSSLKQPELEFELIKPGLPRMRPVPRLLGSNGRPPTLEEEELVPSALIKFQPRETDSIVFCGLANHLLEISEPLATR